MTTLCERISELEAEIERLKASARTAIDAGEVMIRDLRLENAALKRKLRTMQEAVGRMLGREAICRQCGAQFIRIEHEHTCFACESQAHE